METRANYILIGCFTLAVVMSAFGFVYWFYHVGGTGDRTGYRVVFQGPIGGLRSGAKRELRQENSIPQFFCEMSYLLSKNRISVWSLMP